MTAEAFARSLGVVDYPNFRSATIINTFAYSFRSHVYNKQRILSLYGTVQGLTNPPKPSFKKSEKLHLLYRRGRGLIFSNSSHGYLNQEALLIGIVVAKGAS